jgi:hypothetical protein
MLDYKSPNTVVDVGGAVENSKQGGSVTIGLGILIRLSL